MKMKNVKTVFMAALMAVTVMMSSMTTGTSSAVSGGIPGACSSSSGAPPCSFIRLEGSHIGKSHPFFNYISSL